MFTFIDAIKYSVLLSEIIPLFFILFMLKRNQSKIRRIFFLYAVITTLLVIFSLYFRLIYPSKEGYILITRFHNVCEFIFLSTILSNIIISKVVRKIILFSNFIFIIICVVDYLESSKTTLAYVPLLASCTFFILITIFFFFEKLKDNSGEDIFSTFPFWFAVALIANFAGNFLLFGYSETSIRDSNFKINYAIIYGTVTLIKNILFCIAVSMKANLKLTFKIDPDSSNKTEFNKPNTNNYLNF